jgi:hypothetical protein
MPLTVPESIDSGIGPECNKRMHSKSIEILKEIGSWKSSLTYEENVKIGLEVDPSIWGQIIIPEGMVKAEDYTVHRMFKAWDIF